MKIIVEKGTTVAKFAELDTTQINMLEDKITMVVAETDDSPERDILVGCNSSNDCFVFEDGTDTHADGKVNKYLYDAELGRKNTDREGAKCLEQEM